MLGSRALSLVVLLIALIFPAGAAADLNIAPGAHATASSWHEEKLLVEKRDSLPRNTVDGSFSTGWRPAQAATGNQWLQLDFTRPWPMRYAWQRLVTRWDAPPKTYRWEASRDGIHWAKLTQRYPQDASDAAAVEGEGSYLRIVVGEAEEASLLEIEAYAGAGGSGSIRAFSVDVDGNQAHLKWDRSGLSNVFLFRLTRSAGLNIDDNGGQARVTSLVAEGPITHATDKIEFPTVEGIEFAFSWALEAYAPNGRLIGQTSVSESFNIPTRSDSPFAMRGVVEGYYGPGYSMTERADLVRFVGMQGGNFYLYGPKLDPYHRDKWREPYPADEVAAFASLVEYGLSHGVSVAWSLSPGLDYRATAADDAAAIAKYLTMYKAGVRWFSLFMDDIPVDADVTAATEQVNLANRIFEALRETDPDTQLIFVPTVYHGEAAKLSGAERRYLEKLADLAAPIYVAWTGTGVFADTMTRAQMEPIAAIVDRPLVLWDNIPVADFFLGRRLNLGPLEGRASDLAAPSTDGTTAVFGYLANPMWLPAANRLPLATIFAYLLAPDSYQGDLSLGEQIIDEAPADLQPVFALWVDAFRTNPLVGVTESTTTQLLAKARAALERGEAPSPAFLAHAAALYFMEPALADFYYPDLAGDLLSAARDTARIGEAILLRWQGWSSSEENERSDRFSASEELLQSLSGWIVSEGQDEALLQDFGAGVRLQGAPALTGSLPAETIIGRARRFSFDLGGGEGRLFGLPGATMQDGVIHWTPGHTGEYRWVVLSTNDAGTGVKYGSIRVVEVPDTAGGGCQSSGPSSTALLFLGALVVFRRWFRFSFTHPRVFR
jgi:hyaluronoglucosaminidase